MRDTPRSIECWQFPEYQDEAMPRCRRVYADHLNFCLDDGSVLVSAAGIPVDAKTERMSTEDDEATVVRKERADVQTPWPDTELREWIRNVTSTTFQIYDNTEKTWYTFSKL
jgi:hypothetical protein